MKKRYEEVLHNQAYIQAQLDEHGINAPDSGAAVVSRSRRSDGDVRRIWAAKGGVRRAITGKAGKRRSGLLPARQACYQRSC